MRREKKKRKKGVIKKSRYVGGAGEGSVENARKMVHAAADADIKKKMVKQVSYPNPKKHRSSHLDIKTSHNIQIT